MNQTKTICVIGLGYIGLPTAALLANRGYKVHGVDVVQSTVDTINAGNISRNMFNLENNNGLTRLTFGKAGL